MDPRILVVCSVFLAFLATMAQPLQPERMIDFYHYWAFAKAHSMTEEPIGDPYTNREGYREVLQGFGERYLEGGGDSRFERVHQFRISLRRDRAGRTVDKLLPTGPPLLYASFFLLPLDFIAAAEIFRVLQALALVGAMALLIRLFRIRPILGALFTLFVIRSFSPYEIDLRVGNVNSLQLFVAAALLWIVAERLPSSGGRLRLLWGAGFVALSLCFLLVKLNILPFIVALGAHWVLVGWKDRRLLLRSAAIGTGLAAAVFVWSSHYFGSWGGVWIDWWRYIRPGQSGSMLEFSRALGNVSTTLLIEDWTGLSNALVSIALMATLGLSYVAFEIVRARNEAEGGVAPVLRGRFADALRDPGFCASVGIVGVLFFMPLVWYHYYLLLLLPFSWVVSAGGRPGACFVLGLVAMAPFFGPTSGVLQGGVIALYRGSPEVLLDARTALLSLAFVPLWIAILLRPHSPSSQGGR